MLLLTLDKDTTARPLIPGRLVRCFFFFLAITAFGSSPCKNIAYSSYRKNFNVVVTRVGRAH